MTTTTNSSPEEQNATMQQERAFLTKLLESSLNGQFPKLKQLVEDYCRDHNDVTKLQVLTQFKDAKRRTALHFACQSIPETAEAEEDIVHQMLLSGWLKTSDNDGVSSSLAAMIRLKDKEGLTPIMLAVQNPNKLLAQHRVQTLLDVPSGNGGKLGLARSKAGATALHYAAGAGATPTTILTLHNQAGSVAIQTFSHRGGTPLHWASAISSKQDYSETILALLECGANINAHQQTDQGLIPPPLQMSLAACHETHAKLLLEQHAKHDLTDSIHYLLPGGITAFHMAADMNLVGVLSKLLETATSILNAKPAAQNGPLIWERASNEGLTPLQLAAKEKHVGCVLVLLQHEKQQQCANGATTTEDEAKAFIEDFHSCNQRTTNGINLPQPPPSLSPKLKNGEAASSPATEAEKRAKEQAADILSSQEQSPVAEEAKQTALEIKSKGNEQFASKQYQEAIALYTEAISSDPTNATLYSNRSVCWLALDNATQALYDGVMARTLKPDWPKAAYRMAMARSALHLYEDAAVAAWEGLQQEPENAELKALLQKCVKLGRKEHLAKQQNGKEET